MRQWKTHCRVLFIFGTAAVMAALLLIYHFAAEPLRIAEIKTEMNHGYRRICDMDLKSSGLAEEEAEDLDELNRSVSVVITDAEFRLIYGTDHIKSDRDVSGLFREESASFSENAEAAIGKRPVSRSNEISLKGLVKENDEVFYVYLYKTLHSLHRNIRFSERTLFFGFLLFFCIETIVFLLVSAELFRPMEQLLVSLKLIAGGNFWKREERKGRTDILLHDALNPVADQMFRQNASLQNYRYLLENSKTDQEHSGTMSDQLISNITHQLKAPLAIISSQLELDYMETDPEKKAYYYESVMDEIDKMSILINGILKEYRNPQPYVTIRLRRINISDLLSEMTDKYESWLGTREIRLEVKITPGLYVTADPVQMEQVINNFMMNACQHTKKGKSIRLSLEDEENKCAILVHNEGDGIPEDELSSVWMDHYRGEERTDSETEGNGLGLYIAAMIIRKHQGSYGVFNDDTGVTFWLRLSKC